MNSVRRSIRRLRVLFRRANVESELSDEVRLHIDMEADYLIGQGWEPSAALREAERRLGGEERTKDAVRAARPLNWLDDAWADLRLGLRLIRRQPVFSFAVVASLAIGIGANSAIFGLANAVMWRTLPVPEAAELWKIGDRYPWVLARVLEQDDRVLDGAAASQRIPVSVEIDGRTTTVDGRLVSGEYFDVLRLRPLVGRVITAQDDRIPNGHPVVVLSYGYWSRQFARDPAIVGQRISLAGEPFTIIGVTPAEFFGVEVGSMADIFVPAVMQPTVAPMLGNAPDMVTGQFRVLARLHAGVSPAQAAEALSGSIHNAVSGEGRADLSSYGDTPRAQLQTLGLWPEPTSAANGFSELRNQFAQPLLVLTAAVGTLLLIACTNTANLMLARSGARRRELATRLALGAGRLRIIRQLAVESLLLTGLGGIAGFALAVWITRLLPAFLSRGRDPIVIDMGLDGGVLAFTAGVTLLAGVLFGLAPIVRATRSSAISSIKQAPNTKGRPPRLTTDRAIAVSQIALSLALLIGAGMFLRSMAVLDQRDGGFQRDQVLIARMEPTDSGRRFPREVGERIDGIYRELLRTIRATPGVRSASLAEFTPTTEAGIRERFPTPAGVEADVHIPMIYPAYFETMGIPFVSGHDFRPGDLSTDSGAVVIVNEAFARRWMRDASPIGRACPVAVLRSEQPCEIIGVVRDSPYAGFTEEVLPTVYQPFLQTATNRGAMALHVRVSGDPSMITALLREAVVDADPDAPQFEMHTLADEVDAALVRERMLAMLVSCFGALALMLASVGLYGLFAYLAVLRRNEIGVRIALGARRSDIVAIVMREAMTLLTVGSLIGLAGGVAAIRVAQSQISGTRFGLAVLDLPSVAGALLTLGAVALLAAYFPARTASLTDPNIVMRSD